MSSTWGFQTWGSNSWNSDVVTVSLTGLPITSAVGDEESFNVEGWGRQAWNNSGWGVEYSVEPTGQSITSSVGSVTATQVITAELNGFGINVDATFPTVDAVSSVSLTGVGITFGIGTVNAENLAGWVDKLGVILVGVFNILLSLEECLQLSQ